MILGVGDGTFAILFVTVASILLAFTFAYFFPRAALFSTALCIALPFITFAIIESAPRKAAPVPTASTSALYHEQPMDASDVVDTLFPVRIVLLTLLCLAVLVAFGVYVYDVLNAPLYTAPTVQCRRKQLEALHPSWYK